VHPTRTKTIFTVALCAACAALTLVATSMGRGPGNARTAADGFHGWHGKHASAYDEQYLQGSIEGDRFEIAGGKLALKNGANQKIKDLGSTLIADHSKSLKESIALAKKFKIKIPPKPSPSQQWELATVAGFTGSAFDKSYASLEVLDHQQDIQEAGDEVDNGSSWKIRKSAFQEIPTSRDHLAASRDALKAVS
jgi:putative membrane protein